MTAEFGGLVAAVTGGSSGIGLATAVELMHQGATVVSLDVAHADLPEGLVGLRCDVRSQVDLDEAMASVVTLHGRLDVLVNNAGVESRGTVGDATDEEWARVLDVNVVGMARAIKAALPYLRQSPCAAIVNTCSVAAERGMAGLAVYSASKGAVLALTRAVAADLLVDRIRVNCVSPGTVDTPWIDRLLASSADAVAQRSTLEQRQPMKRLVAADEVARAIAFLASPISPSITGTSLLVDGGLVGLHRPA